MDDSGTIERIARHLGESRRVLFVTGAGISADSGLPTYRGVGGLYEGKDTEHGLPIEVALSGTTFAARPDITWKYLAQIERTCRGAQPNAAHRAIAELERRLPYVMVLTQNVDGLHGKAGSRRVIEIHGRLDELLCTVCDHRAVVEDLEGWGIPPSCPECGAVLRPNVVLFGEALPGDALGRLFAALHEGFDMVFAVGTSAIFPYIAHAVLDAARRGAPTVEINPVATRLTEHVAFRLRMGAAEAMAAIVSRLPPIVGPR